MGEMGVRIGGKVRNRRNEERDEREGRRRNKIRKYSKE